MTPPVAVERRRDEAEESRNPDSRYFGGSCRSGPGRRDPAAAAREAGEGSDGTRVSRAQVQRLLHVIIAVIIVTIYVMSCFACTSASAESAELTHRRFSGHDDALEIHPCH